MAPVLALTGHTFIERQDEPYIDALSIDAVASLYRVHRATAARWLAGVRAAVLRQVAE